MALTYTGRKENQIFLIYKEIQSGAVANSYMTITASSYMGKYLRISSYMRKPFLIYDFATAPLKISLYEENLIYIFISVISIYIRKSPRSWSSDGRRCDLV